MKHLSGSSSLASALGSAVNSAGNSVAQAVASANAPTRKVGKRANPDVYDQDWVATAAFMIVMMQVGFAMLEAGCVRYKNVNSIIIKVVINTVYTVIIFWLLGFGFAFGADAGEFIGTDRFAGAGFESQDYILFVFQAACATVAASIMSGGTAERMTFVGWALTSTIFSGFVYAVACHWGFGGGWLEDHNYHDFAGSGVVHFVGGVGALVTTVILKPRTGRFDPDNNDQFLPYNQPLVAFGCLLLYSCWLFFNSGTTFAGDQDQYTQGLVAMNTFLAGSSGAIVAFFLGYFSSGVWGLVPLMNGMLTGLVCVTGACDDIETWAAVIFGIFGGVTYHVLAKVLLKSKIDDPIDAVPVHFGGGLVGTILTGFFVRTGGLFYSGNGVVLGIQLVAVIVFFFWSAIMNSIVLLFLKSQGKLRVSEKAEGLGIDITHCGGEAINSQNYWVEPVKLQDSQVVVQTPPPMTQLIGQPLQQLGYPLQSVIRR